MHCPVNPGEKPQAVCIVRQQAQVLHPSQIASYQNLDYYNQKIAVRVALWKKKKSIVTYGGFDLRAVCQFGDGLNLTGKQSKQVNNPEYEFFESKSYK